MSGKRKKPAHEVILEVVEDIAGGILCLSKDRADWEAVTKPARVTARVLVSVLEEMDMSKKARGETVVALEKTFDRVNSVVSKDIAISELTNTLRSGIAVLKE